jgi:hypothetical protein
VLLVLLHLAVAVLLRIVIRRAGVGPWISTIAASLFVLFGAGRDDIIWPFQVGFVGALLFGLTHLLLADHDGPVDRRDWLGILAGLAGLLCSGVAVTMTVVVGLATLARRGWRIAALHTAPLAVVYTVWWAIVGRTGYSGAGFPSIGRLVSYTRRGIGATFTAVGQLPGAGVALGVLLLVGLVLAWGRRSHEDRLRRVATPGAMLIGSVVFFLIAGLGRANPFTGAARLFQAPTTPSRYLYVGAALMLPALAVAADAVVRRWRLLAPAVLVLLLIGVPGNLHELANRSRLSTFGLSYRRLVLALPRLSVARRVPRSTTLPGLAYFPRSITIGWLLDGVASGRIPDAGRIEPVDAATWTLRLALSQTHASTSAGCHSLVDTETLTLENGQSIGIVGGAVRVVYTPGGRARSRPVPLDPLNGHVLTALAGPLKLRLSSNNPARPAGVCE